MEHGKGLEKLTTESQNQATRNIDTLPTEDVVTLIVKEDEQVLAAVRKEIPQIVAAAELLTGVLKQNGRIIYMGSGTSGRLGVLDAAELLPTFGVGEDQIKAIIAGGKGAMFVAVEQAEDDYEAGIKDFLAENPGPQDALVAISASGRTPYVLAALKKANELGATTIGLTCNADSAISKLAQVTIAPVVGPEVVTGSTRMKAGTAQKIVLNTLSTTVMIKIGKVYQNWMVDMVPTNAKLVRRAERMVMEAAQSSEEAAKEALKKADFNIKAAIVMLKAGCNYARAQSLLKRADGVVGRALAIAEQESRAEDVG